MSIKTFLLTLAVAALAFGPVNAAHTKGPASAALARRAAAAKALERRIVTAGKGVTPATGEYAYNTKFMSSKIAQTARRFRCGTAAVCERRAPPQVPNAVSVCYRGRCEFRCDDGFAPDPNSDLCIASASTCGATTCQVPDNGYATCNADGSCNVQCNEPYTLASSLPGNQGTFACIDLSGDAQNCGALNNCPPNGVLRRADNTEFPFYCYTGESSLCRGDTACNVSA
ncbi:hypothetical protein Rhopal_004873-T1 [Rhodotorula paludigena]|uniref:Uncharacterized protein n=1 Tax=Rhodotorula paludigena TaxID=86838 RepID=A0AAV5GH05_9BASI|nr:hypothetical protein Rhopal_004873-T1 [Rhodotorula paludigena]